MKTQSHASAFDAHTLTLNLGGHWRNGRGSSPCPICQPERRQDQRALSISQRDGKLLLWCFKSNCSFSDIAKAANLPLESAQIDMDAARKTRARQAAYDAERLAKARALWKAAGPIQGSHAEQYLRGRAITCELPDSLRWVPDTFHGPTASWCGAMIANVSTGGIHRTFFDKQGKRLPKKVAKMMWGPCGGGHVALSDTPGPLVVVEGIETGLALLSGLLARPARVWAALSTSGIKPCTCPRHRARSPLQRMAIQPAERRAIPWRTGPTRWAGRLAYYQHRMAGIGRMCWPRKGWRYERYFPDRHSPRSRAF